MVVQWSQGVSSVEFRAALQQIPGVFRQYSDISVADRYMGESAGKRGTRQPARGVFQSALVYNVVCADVYSATTTQDE